jgi:hypothetical protein
MDPMGAFEPADASTPSDASERRGVHDELLNRLKQYGVYIADRSATDAELADLLSAIDSFDRAVEDAGGDLFIDAPDSSEPELPAFVLPHLHDDEHVSTYIHRIENATRRLREQR